MMSGTSPLIFLLLQGFGYGFLAGVTIGPFLGYVINVVLTRGWRGSWALIAVPVVVDTPIILTMLFILSEVPEFVLDVMSIVGGGFVLWLGISTWRENQRTGGTRSGMATQNNHQHHDGVTLSGIFTRGLLVNALNPAPYLFWSTVAGPQLLRGIEQGGAGYALGFLIAYYSIFLTLIFALMLAIERLGEVNDRFHRYLLPVTIVLLLVLGIGLLGTGVVGLVAISQASA